MEGLRIPLLQAREWIREVVVSVSVLVGPPSRLVVGEEVGGEDESSRLAVLPVVLDQPKLAST